MKRAIDSYHLEMREEGPAMSQIHLLSFTEQFVSKHHVSCQTFLSL